MENVHDRVCAQRKKDTISHCNIKLTIYALVKRCSGSVIPAQMPEKHIKLHSVSLILEVPQQLHLNHSYSYCS